MSRLVVFGCSLVYGVGLPDCHTNTTKPSKFSWAQLVADQMNRTLVNKSFPGSSNKRIWKTINDFKFKQDDVVMVLWSFPSRYTIFQNPLKIKDLHHNFVDFDPTSKSYYEDIYAFYDSFVMSKLYADHANRILKEQNLTVYNLTIDNEFNFILGKTKPLPVYMAKFEDSYPKALDNDHLGLEGHRAFAADVLDKIGTKHTIVCNTKPYSLFKQLKNAICK